MSSKDLHALAADVRAEVNAIGRSVVDMAEAHAAVGTPPSRVALWACGGTLHAFYTGIEKTLETIAATLNGRPAAGPGWHRRLLRRMAEDVPGVRPAVLRSELATQLDEYLSFRHRYRNLYLFDLRWEPIRVLLDGAPALWAEVSADLLGFADVLETLAGADHAAGH